MYKNLPPQLFRWVIAETLILGFILLVVTRPFAPPMPIQGDESLSTPSPSPIADELVLQQEVATPTMAAPVSAGVAVASPVPTPTTTSKRTVYVVKSGDELKEIADMYKVSMADIIEANKIDDPDSIYEGQELIIPGAN